MLREPPDLSAARVLDAVRTCWDEEVTRAEHVPVPSPGCHWCVGGEEGPRWLATADPVDGAEQRSALVSAYTGAAVLAGGLDFVVAPVTGRGGAITEDLARSHLLSVAPYLAESAPAGGFAGDHERAEVATMLARLHGGPRPSGVPLWRPRIGWRQTVQREQLDWVLAGRPWVGGPCAEPAWRLVAEHRTVLAAALRRFDLLAAATSGTASAWVPTHGAPHGRNVRRGPDGARLVDWSALAVAPRERDLRHVFGGATGTEAELAYLAGGGSSTLSSDVLELFALEQHLSEIGRHALRFSRQHEGDADDLWCLADLEARIGRLAAGG